MGFVTYVFGFFIVATLTFVVGLILYYVFSFPARIYNTSNQKEVSVYTMSMLLALLLIIGQAVSSDSIGLIGRLVGGFILFKYITRNEK